MIPSTVATASRIQWKLEIGSKTGLLLTSAPPRLFARLHLGSIVLGPTMEFWSLQHGTVEFQDLQEWKILLLWMLDPPQHDSRIRLIEDLHGAVGHPWNVRLGAVQFAQLGEGSRQTERSIQKAE